MMVYTDILVFGSILFKKQKTEVYFKNKKHRSFISKKENIGILFQNQKTYLDCHALQTAKG